MSGAKINNFSIGDANIESLMLATDELFAGFHKVSLTNYDTTDESQVAAGSIVECAGALYKFSSNESITGSPSDGTVYIRIVPDTTTCTLEYTNTAPTWSDAYQGWYGTGGAVTYRYIEFVLGKVSSLWRKTEKPGLSLGLEDSESELWIETNDTWTAPRSKYYTIFVTGSGGDGASAAYAGNQIAGGGGAGATSIKRIWIDAGTVWTATFSSTEAQSTTFTDGITTISALNGSNGNNGVSRANGGAGGTSGAGYDILIKGGDGGGGIIATNGLSGFGGTSYYGGGGRSETASTFTNGSDGRAYGSGGSGAISISGSNGTGGAGKSGVIHIKG